MTAAHLSYKTVFGIYNMLAYIFRKEIYGDKDTVASTMCRHMQQYVSASEELDFIERNIVNQ